MAGIKDVAREAGVSMSTVSYVLSGKRSVSAKTTKKVLAAIDKLGYIPDASAQKLRGGLNHIIAISEPMRRGMNQTEYSAYFMQTAWQAKAAGYDVLLLTGEDAVGDIQRVTRSNLVDGVVLLDVEEQDERAAAAHTYGKPCVAIGYPQEHEDCACVDIDFEQLGHVAADRLHTLGHRSVALIRAAERDYKRGSGYVLIFYRSFLERAKQLGIAVRVFRGTEAADFDVDRFVADLLADSGQVTAIVSQGAASVLSRVLDGLARAGVDVPRDLSVLSCGTFLRDESMRRPISEEPKEPERLCSMAMSLLVSAIESSRDIRGEVSLISPVFVDRGSLAKRPLRVGSVEGDGHG